MREYLLSLSTSSILILLLALKCFPRWGTNDYGIDSQLNNKIDEFMLQHCLGVCVGDQEGDVIALGNVSG